MSDGERAAGEVAGDGAGGGGGAATCSRAAAAVFQLDRQAGAVLV